MRLVSLIYLLGFLAVPVGAVPHTLRAVEPLSGLNDALRRFSPENGRTCPQSQCEHIQKGCDGGINVNGSCEKLVCLDEGEPCIGHARGNGYTCKPTGPPAAPGMKCAK